MIEAGLGGRYDATNVIPSKVQVLTSVGLEHTRWLGPTIADIAREKLDVVQAGATLVLGHGLHPDALEVAHEVAARARRADRATRAPSRASPVGGSGAFQRRNFALARAAAEAYLGALDPAAVRAAGGGGARSRAAPDHRRGAADAARRRPQPRRHGGAGRVAAGDRRRGTTASWPSSRSSTTRTRRGCCGRCCRSAMRSSSRAVTIPARCRRPPCNRSPVSSRARPPRWSATRGPRCAGPASWPGRGGVVLATGSIYLVADLLAPAGRRRASML